MPLSVDDISLLYRRHARAMVTYFARRTFSPDAAVDLVAETFAAALRDRAQFRGGEGDDATAWLYGIARHQLSGWYRDGAVERRALARLGVERRELTEAEHERIVELAGLEDLRGRVAAAVGELPAEQRVALRLRVGEERPYDEVAAALGTSEQAARQRVSRALRALGALLSDGEEEKPHARA